MKPHVHLFSHDTFPVAWERVLSPWFEMASAKAWQHTRRSLVVIPFRSHAYFLKGLLLEAGRSVAGIHFVTPADLRAWLLPRQGLSVPLREHLRLLLSIAAEQAALKKGNFLAANAVARAPDHLLHAIDQLSAGGWRLDEKGPPELRPVFHEFERLLSQCNFTLLHEADRAAWPRADHAEPLFERLIITGFNAAHWPLWPLLRAAAAAATEATVLLADPSERARDLDECWVGTWEENFRPAEPLPALETETGRPFEILGTQTPTVREDVHFLVGSTATEQAQAITAMAIHFLDQKSCTRLGILFRGPGTLARQAAASLRDAGVPHNDGIAQLAPGPFEDAVWRAWLELQDAPHLGSLLRFLRAHPAASDLFENLNVKTVAAVLERAYQDVLIDDLALLREYCAQEKSDDHRRVAAGLTRLRFLPQNATFVSFLAEAEAAFVQLGWKERSGELARLSVDCQRVDVPFSRAIFLRWLDEITISTQAVRDDLGSHPYSRVHLLPYAQADAQQWSHLILAGLNQGEWPRPEDESGFLREQDIDELNREIKKLNRSAVRQGNQGEGHVSVVEGKALCLGPVEQRQLELRSLWNLVESAGAGLALTASLYDETAPERFRNPSEFFTHVYFQARAKTLSQETMKSLREQTRSWLEESRLFLRTDENGEVEQTRSAYDARRRPDVPVGNYEFAMTTAPNREITLAATTWEKALRSPAIVWMKTFLGVESSGAEIGSWNLATGQWVHRWMAAASGAAGRNQVVEFPNASEITQRVRADANDFHARVEQLLRSSQKIMPDWWRSGWENAVARAEGLAQRLSVVTGWPMLATEWKVPAKISFAAKRELRLRGRIDLLLARPVDMVNELEGADLWLVDYKTGRVKGLLSKKDIKEGRDAAILKKLQSGAALQIALYALALRQLGAAKIEANFVSGVADFADQPISVEDVLKHDAFWAELCRMQETGVFGGRGALRDEFSFAGEYPLATLAIDRDLLEEKWALTHPALANSNGEEDE